MTLPNLLGAVQMKLKPNYLKWSLHHGPEFEVFRQTSNFITLNGAKLNNFYNFAIRTQCMLFACTHN